MVLQRLVTVFATASKRASQTCIKMVWENRGKVWGDECPFGKNESASSFLISSLDVGKRVASESDNFLVFASNVEETLPMIKEYLNYVCANKL